MAAGAKADNRGCSAETLRGAFAERDSGFLIAPPAPLMAGPYAGLSTVTFDGKGGVTEIGMVSLNGNSLAVTAKGTYTVNPDCTGTLTVTISPVGITSHSLIVIADGGNEIEVLPIDPGLTAICVARRQYPVGDWRQ